MAYLRQLNGKDVRISTLYLKPLSGQDQVQQLRYDDILNHFSAFGDITSVRLRNKRRRSYGFVKFTQPKSAATALQTKIHTIAGRKVEINAAHARFQDWVRLLDLNNDCLLGIFSEKCLSEEDLCSVAETSRRLKEIAVEVFRRQYKKYLIPQARECSERYVWSSSKGDFIHCRDKVVVAKRTLVNFGSVMSELQINANRFEENKQTNILDSVARYCGDSLGSLTLENFDIPQSFVNKLRPIFNKLLKCKMRYCTGVSKELFAECPAMVELIIHSCEDMRFITEKTFPKLQHFEYKERFLWPDAQVKINFESFLLSHQNLQGLNFGPSYNERSSLLQSIADNCRQLDYLQFDMPQDSTFDLSNFVRLRKLKVDLDWQSATRSLLGWNNLHFLVEIKFKRVEMDSELVTTLSQLEGLHVLELKDCIGIQNLQRIDDKNQLTKLKISRSNNEINFDWARLIQRLGNLQYLHLDIRIFDSSHGFFKFDNFDTETSQQIVEIVGRRPQKPKLHFRIGTECDPCYSGHCGIFGNPEHVRNDVFYQNRHLVEMLLVCVYCGLKFN